MAARGETVKRRMTETQYNKDMQEAPPARVGLSGKMRSGKDTTARLLSAYGFRRLAFADRLKELASELFGMDPGEKRRPLLVALGRKMCEVDPDVWVKRVLATMPVDQRIVITDLRFPSELKLLRMAGFYVARVECPQHVVEGRLAAQGTTEDAVQFDDPSETALDGRDDWDFLLDGGSTFGNLNTEVDAMAAVMLAGE